METYAHVKACEQTDRKAGVSRSAHLYNLLRKPTNTKSKKFNAALRAAVLASGVLTGISLGSIASEKFAVYRARSEGYTSIVQQKDMYRAELACTGMNGNFLFMVLPNDEFAIKCRPNKPANKFPADSKYTL